MPIRLPRLLLAAGYAAAHSLRRQLLAATRPSAAPLAVGTLADLVRSKPALVAENALLRHQLGGLHRNVKRPRCTSTDRTLLVRLAGRIRAWRSALLIVQPATLLRWHRQLFRRYWRRRSPRATAPAHRPPLALEMVALIQEMAAANRLWGPSAHAASSSNSTSTGPSQPSRSTCATPARHERQARRGRRSCATARPRSGPATSCRSPACASGPCSPASSSRWRRAGSPTSASRATRRMPGSPSNCGRRHPSTRGHAP